MHSRLTLPSLVLCALVLSAPLSRAANWERFRGPNGAGVAQDKNIPVEFSEQKNVIWKTRVPGVGNSSPIVWDKKLFVQSSAEDGSERFLVCIDVVKGQELWRRGIPAAKAPTHKLNTLASATPVTDGEGVYIPFWDGKDVYLVGYTMNGDLMWNKNLGPWVSQHGTGGSPIIYKDKVIFANDMDKDDPKTKKPVTRPSTLFAFNKKTGELAWETPREAYRACYTAPFILETKGAPELIVTSTTSIAAYNPDDGSLIWKWNWTFGKTKSKMPLRTIAGTAYHDGMLFACSGDGGGDRQMAAVAINGQGKNAKPKQIWDNREDFPYVPGPIVRGEHLYFVNDKGLAGCYEARTGNRVWFERIPSATFLASPVLIEDKIYAPSEEGDVHVFVADPAGFRHLATNPMGERMRATPAVADGKLYVRTQHYLYCIGQK